MGEALLVPYTSVRHLGSGPVLVLAPHGDDEVFGCGGAILRHVDAGDAVRVIIVTDGAAELPDTDDPASYAGRRQEESRAAARLLGYGVPEFWNLPDRSVIYGEGLVRRVMAAVQDSGARLLYAPSVMEMHPDHRALGMVAVEAVRRLGGELSLAMYEVGIPLRPNRLLDISDLRERKRAAMRVFESQLARRDYLGHVEALNHFRSYTLGAEVTAAEAYCVVSAQEVAADPMALYVSEARRGAQLGVPLDEQDRPLISVIVRSIGRPTLQDALDSLALQTFPRIEVVVVDALGQGHPPLPALCGRFPLRLVGAGDRLSRSRAANVGLDAAGGEWLAFLDDDDFLDPDHFAALADLLEKHPSVGACFSGVRVIDHSPGGGSEVVRVFHEPYNERRLVYENYLPIHAVLFRRRLVDAGCRFDEGLDVYEDWDFWLQVAQHTPFARGDRVSASYRSAGDSGVGLLNERADRVLEYRAALYRKWLGRWDAVRLDWIFDEYRHARHESAVRGQSLDAVRGELVGCRAALEDAALEHERTIFENERAAQEREEALASELAAERERSGDLAARLEYLEHAHARRWIVRLYRSTRSWPVFAWLWRLAAARRPGPREGAGR